MKARLLLLLLTLAALTPGTALAHEAPAGEDHNLVEEAIENFFDTVPVWALALAGAAVFLLMTGLLALRRWAHITFVDRSE